jgi:hypothetical protein
VRANPYGDVQAALMNLRRRLGHPISTEARRPVEDAVDTPLGAVGQAEVHRSELVDDGEPWQPLLRARANRRSTFLWSLWKPARRRYDA